MVCVRYEIDFCLEGKFTLDFAFVAISISIEVFAYACNELSNIWILFFNFCFIITNANMKCAIEWKGKDFFFQHKKDSEKWSSAFIAFDIRWVSTGHTYIFYIIFIEKWMLKITKLYRPLLLSFEQIFLEYNWNRFLFGGTNELHWSLLPFKSWIFSFSLSLSHQFARLDRIGVNRGASCPVWSEKKICQFPSLEMHSIRLCY